MHNTMTGYTSLPTFEGFIAQVNKQNTVHQIKGLNMLGSLKCHRKKRGRLKRVRDNVNREAQIRKGFRVSVEGKCVYNMMLVHPLYL